MWTSRDVLRVRAIRLIRQRGSELRTYASLTYLGGIHEPKIKSEMSFSQLGTAELAEAVAGGCRFYGGGASRRFQ